MTNKKTDSVVNGKNNSEDSLNKRIEDLEVIIKNLRENKTTNDTQKDFSPNDYIKVISLCDNPLNLSTRPRGGGKIFSFSKFGEIKRMLYSELQDIIANHQKFLEQGYFYILDRKVVELNGLEDLYTTILTKEEIESILSDAPDAIKLFSKANPTQQKIIVDMFIVKIRDGKNVNFNVISIISNISNVNILEKAKEAKEDMNLENK